MEQTDQQATNSDDGKQPEPIARDKSLTLAARKLAGSARCLNCGTDLKGPFCHYCGQPDRNFMRFFPALLRDVMEDVLDLDSRFMRTLKPLLFKPGKLTRDYMNGRRFRYAPPMRVYIFSSIVFFLLAALLSSNAINIEARNGDLVIVEGDTAEEQQQVESALGNLPDGIRDQIEANPELQDVEDALDEAEHAREESHADESAGFDTSDIQFNDKPWDRETNPVDIKWLPDWLNDRINDEIEGSPQKTEQINANPNLIIDKVFDILPATMFILLPVVALIFKFWYMFAKRYYVEHLIFSLHNHSFIFVLLTLVLLAGLTADMAAARDFQALATGIQWLTIAAWCWIPLYLLISLRVMYRQNWFMTLAKYFVIGISYVALLGFVTTGVAIASFVLL
jgi:hypothetical protein